MKIEKYIAERKLLFSDLGSKEQHEFTVKIGLPHATRESIELSGVARESVCVVEFEGLNERSIDFIGMDSVQALSMAVDIDKHLNSLRGKYEFYWGDGDSYFD